MEWKFADNAETQTAADLWYGINNGYIRPSVLLEKEVDIALLDAAIDTINSFFDAGMEIGLIAES